MKKIINITNIFLFLIIVSLIYHIGRQTNNTYKAVITNDLKSINTTKLNVVSPTNKGTEKETSDKEEVKTDDSPKIEINTKKEVTTDNSKEIAQKNVIPKTSENDNEIRVGTVLTGNMTAYGRDCCSSDVEQQGKTSSGYNLRINGNTYHDKQYGELRILASDKSFPLYSVIKITDPKDGIYNAIVLDRAGSNIGINKKYLFDLVVESQEYARLSYGIHSNVKFEVLRLGK